MAERTIEKQVNLLNRLIATIWKRKGENFLKELILFIEA